MLDILALGDHYETVDAGRGLTNLKPAATAVCRDRFRRIDRFTQMALLGSARCMETAEPGVKTGLYIGSRFASTGNTIAVHEKMVSAGVVPKPANFINTLSNAAGYFVARNLGLEDRNLFVSRGDASIVAALQLAGMDVTTGAVVQALVGSVDEAVLPLEHHRYRLGLEPGTDMGEGSHWLLVGSPGQADSLATITDMVTLRDETALAYWLDGLNPGERYRLSLSPWTRQQMASTCFKSRPMLKDYDPELAAYPGHATGAIIRYLQSGAEEALIVIAADNDGRFHSVVVRPNTGSG